MKATTLRILVGVTTPLILTGSVQAGFTGISAVSKPNEFGLLVVNVYAEFDRPGEDQMLGVGGTPLDPLTISVIGGTFFQHAEGGDTAPDPALFGPFPSLRYDTFVTIGVKSFNVNNPGVPEGQPEDFMILTPTWPGFDEAELRVTMDGWAITPDNAQGNPFDPEFVGGDGRTLIGQFSVVGVGQTVGVEGVMVIQYVSDGQSVTEFVQWLSLPGPGAMALFGTAGLIGVRRRRR